MVNNTMYVLYVTVNSGLATVVFGRVNKEFTYSDKMVAERDYLMACRVPWVEYAQLCKE